MATSSKKTLETDYSMQDKIHALYDLQQIDSKIDEINKLKGELPLEVQDLEDEVAGLETRIENIKEAIAATNTQVSNSKEQIEMSKIKIAKYNEQQGNVRNNREYDSLSKQIEDASLDIELAEKDIRGLNAEITVKSSQLEAAIVAAEERRIDLAAKKTELDTIDQETAQDIAKLEVQSAKAAEKIDERLLSAYNRIRKNVRNGLGVVSVQRNSCGGCFNRIPPQRQFDILLSKKIIVCEYCGRILVPDFSAVEEQ
ncbi:MAG: C4-type zinc ribbon domain-containing protein [Rikenellaceae bacterium]